LLALFFESLLLLLFLPHTAAWEQRELDLYDLVEEVGVDFYSILGVPEVRFSLVEPESGRC